MGQLSAAAARWLPFSTLSALALLLANMYFVRVRVLSDLVTVLFCGTAILALVGRAEARPFLAGLARWLGVAGGLVLAAFLLGRAVSGAEALRALHSLLLIAGFVLFARAALRQLGAARLMRVLFAAGAISAATSVALHLLTAEPLWARIEMLGRAWNPIPAAAAIAAAGLAGLALLRGGCLEGRWRGMAWAGLGAILLAMLLTQSRGPLIGALLGAALLLLPPQGARRGWMLPPLAFLAASSLVLLEAPLRMLFCEGDGLFCRPSLRQELWSKSLELILAEPLTGMGMGHPLGEGWLNNPQNAVLATAVYFGLPFLLAALVALGLLLRRAARLEPTVAVRWAMAMMVFSAAYFSFEPSPFAFYNAHYLFFWLPVAVLLSVSPAPERKAAG